MYECVKVSQKTFSEILDHKKEAETDNTMHKCLLKLAYLIQKLG